MRIDFEKDYEVAVVGGGIAGVAAALAAARKGKKTVLIEKTVLLGGLATSGLVYIYLPLCDGNGTQVTFGICEELIKLSLKYGPGEIPEGWRDEQDAVEQKRYRCCFSPAAFILAIDEVLLEAGVDIWLDTLVCDAVLDENKQVKAVEVENESGRGKINAECFIDASGSGITARKVGGACYDEVNYTSVWALEYDKNKNALADKVSMFVGGCSSFANPEMLPTFRKIDGKMVSDFVLSGRQILRDHYQKEYSSNGVEKNELFALKVPAMPQFRKTYAVKGKKTLDNEQHSTRFSDSIGLAADWRKSGYVWEIPYGTLVPETLKGVLTAGRCISSIGDAWEITRVIPCAALTGEAAGTAAAMAVDRNITPDQLDISELQEELRGKGFAIHLADLGL